VLRKKSLEQRDSSIVQQDKTSSYGNFHLGNHFFYIIIFSEKHKDAPSEHAGELDLTLSGDEIL